MQLEFSPKVEQELNEIAGAMAAMVPGVQDYLYGEMTIAAARRFAKVARASPRFKDRTGNLRKSIRAVRIDVETDDGREVKDGGALATMGGRKAPHAAIIEGGTVQRRQTSTGRRTGMVRAGRMMGEAFDSSQKDAVRDAVMAGRRNFNKLVKAANKEGKLTKRQVKVLGT